jgi:ribosomal protein L37AE/L43A
MTTADFDFHPHNNPCAQCGKPIASPVWSEPGDACVTYVWACKACGYEFACTAVFGHTSRTEDRPIAA